MPYFLERIAKLLTEKEDGNLRNHCLVFPNRRAGLYFLKYLSAQIGRPVWAPAVMTINELFGSFSELIIAENEILLFELYKVYRRLNPAAESFDEFYFWGDMLVSDFDDTDKYLADASVLFRNVQDFKKIDEEFGALEHDKVEIIKRFWNNFEPKKPSSQKTDFRLIWSILLSLYNEFKDSLRSKGMAYEGMIYRDVVSRIKPWENNGIKWQTIHFIGFNALNRCEELLMKELQKTGRAKFYWDYDNSYINGGKLNSAGLFLSKNLGIFGNDMPSDWNYNTFLSSGNTRVSAKIIETTSDIAQVKIIPQLLKQIPGITSEDAHHTAVILADENLLVPVLTSFPSDTGDVNVTMGYPLKMTNVYTLVKYLLNLQRDISVTDGRVLFDYHDVNSIIRHELIEKLLDEEDIRELEKSNWKSLRRVPSGLLCRSANLKKIFDIPASPHEYSHYLRDILVAVSQGENVSGEEDKTGSSMQSNLKNEFIYRILLTINRLEAIFTPDEISFKTETYIRILDKILRNQSVPFTGEPLAGIQIMGILETRALDFRNIIMLSVNEGVLPTVTSGSSFIPYSIREAFGLPVINHQESVYAYHFYRLMHRAENVTFVYNSASDGLKTGEISRFLTQMRYEQIIRPEILNLSFDIRPPVTIGTEIERTAGHSSVLYSLYLNNGSGKILSPTAINTWLNCRMRFYYRYVNGLKEPEKVPLIIDHAVFGLLLHRIMKIMYDPYIGKEVTEPVLASIISDNDRLSSLIDRAVNECFNYNIDTAPDGNEIVIREVLNIYLHRILDADRSVAPFRIIALESPFHFTLPVTVNNNDSFILSGGNIDRIDYLSGTTRVVDYKTGEISRTIGSVQELFADDRKKDSDGWLQTLLYCEAYHSRNQGEVTRPSIYKIRELTGQKFSDNLRIKAEKAQEILLNDYEEVRNDFLEGLTKLVETIFSDSEPFRMTKTTGKCVYCPFRKLCQR